MCADRRRIWNMHTVHQLLLAFATTLFRDKPEIDWLPLINFRDQAYLLTIL